MHFPRLGTLLKCLPVVACLFVASFSVAQEITIENNVAASHTTFKTPLDPNDVRRQNFSFDTRLRYNSALVNGVKTLNVLVAAKAAQNTID
jgi:hypothetical protein